MSLDTSEGVAVFTDGSSYWKDRSGGWAYVALDAFGGTRERWGYTGNTTNNQMELAAPANALADLYVDYGPAEVLILSDSEYVVLGCQNPERARRRNKVFWENLDFAIGLHTVEFEWIKGHSGVKYNTRADKLAGQARKREI